MAGAVRHKCDETAAARGCWNEFIQRIANAFNNLQICALIAATDIIPLARPPFFENELQRLDVIFYVEPIADVRACAIDRQRFFLEPVQDH